MVDETRNPFDLQNAESLAATIDNAPMREEVEVDIWEVLLQGLLLFRKGDIQGWEDALTYIVDALLPLIRQKDRALAYLALALIERLRAE